MKHFQLKLTPILVIILFFNITINAASLPDISKEQGGLIVVMGSPDPTQANALIDLSKKKNWLIQILETDPNKKQAGFELSWPLSIALGAAQGLSIIPGLSRSGLTTSILLFSDFTGEEAFRVSFLMSIPTSFAAAFGLMLVEGFRPDVMSALSTVVAATISYITIDTLLELAHRINLWKICVYIGTLAIIAWLPNLI